MAGLLGYPERGMRKAVLLAMRIGAAVVALAVALPLGSWASARVPVVARVSLASTHLGSSGMTFFVHRRVRPQRRDSSAYHGNWSRDLTVGVSVSQSLHAFRPEDRPFQRAAADIPPPDLPPA